MRANPEKVLAQREKTKKWKKENRDRIRVHKLKDMYGITPQELEEFRKKQNSACGICKRHQDEFFKDLHIDHIHDTKIVRGLLCFSCNSKLGWYEKWKDEIEEYLK